MVNKPCIDCGAAPVVHSLEWIASLLESIFSIISKPIEILWRKISNFFSCSRCNNFLFNFFRYLTKTGIVRIIDYPDEQVSMRTKVLWEEAQRRKIKMYEIRLFNLARDFYMAEYEGMFISFEGLPRLKVSDSKSLSWMDNKSVMKRRFKQIGIPVAEGGACFTERGAMRIFRKLGPPVILLSRTLVQEAGTLL